MNLILLSDLPLITYAGSSSSSLKIHGFESAANNLTLALEARHKGKVFRDPSKWLQHVSSSVS